MRSPVASRSFYLYIDLQFAPSLPLQAHILDNCYSHDKNNQYSMQKSEEEFVVSSSVCRLTAVTCFPLVPRVTA